MLSNRLTFFKQITSNLMQCFSDRQKFVSDFNLMKPELVVYHCEVPTHTKHERIPLIFPIIRNQASVIKLFANFSHTWRVCNRFVKYSKVTCLCQLELLLQAHWV